MILKNENINIKEPRIELHYLPTCDKCGRSRAMTFMARVADGRLLCRGCWIQEREAEERLTNRKNKGKI